MKALKLAALGVLFLLALGLIARNQLIKMEARRWLAEQTGFRLEIGRLKTHLWASRAELLDVVVRNPPDYPEPTAFVIGRAYLEIDPWALVRRETHLRVVELEIPRVVIVRKRDGEVNLQRLSGGAMRASATASQSDTAASPIPVPPRSDEAEALPNASVKGRLRSPERPFRIDRLRIRVDAVEYHDFNVNRAEPDITKLKLKIDREHSNVTSVQQIGELLATGVLDSAADHLMGDLGGSIQRVVEDEKLRGELRKLGRDVKRMFKGMFEPPTE